MMMMNIITSYGWNITLTVSYETSLMQLAQAQSDINKNTLYNIIIINTVGPAVHYGHLGTNHKCPDYQSVRSIKAPFGTITKCLDYAGVLIFKSLINRFHCIITYYSNQEEVYCCHTHPRLQCR